MKDRANSDDRHDTYAAHWLSVSTKAASRIYKAIEFKLQSIVKLNERRIQLSTDLR